MLDHAARRQTCPARRCFIILVARLRRLVSPARGTLFLLRPRGGHLPAQTVAPARARPSAAGHRAARGARAAAAGAGAHPWRAESELRARRYAWDGSCVLVVRRCSCGLGRPPRGRRAGRREAPAPRHRRAHPRSSWSGSSGAPGEPRARRASPGRRRAAPALCAQPESTALADHVKRLRDRSAPRANGPAVSDAAELAAELSRCYAC